MDKYSIYKLFIYFIKLSIEIVYKWIFLLLLYGVITIIIKLLSINIYSEYVLIIDNLIF
jgi:hypothetical protein